MRISDWSSDVCSSDLGIGCLRHLLAKQRQRIRLRIAAMDDERKTRLLRRMDVTAKTVPLPRPVALVVMIIEPGTADAADARVSGPRHHLRRSDIGVTVRDMRVEDRTRVGLGKSGDVSGDSVERRCINTKQD